MAPDAEALAALHEVWSQVQAMPSEPVVQAKETQGGAEDSTTDPLAAAREIAIRRLSVRARSRKELAQDLKSRDIPSAAADQVLDRLAEVGLVDDAAFAQEWVDSRGRRSGAGRLRQELRLKGVAEEHIAEAIGDRGDDADLTNARELAVRKAASMNGLDRLVRQRRLTAFLGRRGFSSAVIRRVVGEVLGGQAEAADD